MGLESVYGFEDSTISLWFKMEAQAIDSTPFFVLIVPEPPLQAEAVKEGQHTGVHGERAIGNTASSGSAGAGSRR